MIYLDYAASAPVLPEAVEAALHFMTAEYANPSSIHRAAEESRAVIDCARRETAGMLNASPEEIIFTSGGTESDNLAVFGANGGKLRHIVTTAIEHEAVLQAAKAWLGEPVNAQADVLCAADGRTVTFLYPDAFGRVGAADVETAVQGILSRDPSCAGTEILVSVMTANNELGTVEPIAEIGDVCAKCGVLFHTDAVQAFGHIPLDVKEMHIDLLSASGHKFGAPKGVGFLYASPRAKLKPLIYGGGQERKKRSGTLNTPGIAGLYEAEKYAQAQMEASGERIAALRDGFLKTLTENVPGVAVNGPLAGNASCLPGHLNVSFSGVESESLLILLDLHGIAASAGSACASGALEPSHVLMALPGMTKTRANSSLRFTFGEQTTREEAEEAARIVAEDVKSLREMSGH